MLLAVVLMYQMLEKKSERLPATVGSGLYLEQVVALVSLELLYLLLQFDSLTVASLKLFTIRSNYKGSFQNGKQ
jgi:hypothetical protein